MEHGNSHSPHYKGSEHLTLMKQFRCISEVPSISKNPCFQPTDRIFSREQTELLSSVNPSNSFGLEISHSQISDRKSNAEATPLKQVHHKFIRKAKCVAKTRGNSRSHCRKDKLVVSQMRNDEGSFKRECSIQLKRKTRLRCKELNYLIEACNSIRSSGKIDGIINKEKKLVDKWNRNIYDTASNLKAIDFCDHTVVEEMYYLNKDSKRDVIESIQHIKAVHTPTANFLKPAKKGRVIYR